jgi:hypothetical protein
MFGSRFFHRGLKLQRAEGEKIAPRATMRRVVPAQNATKSASRVGGGRHPSRSRVTPV